MAMLRHLPLAHRRLLLLAVAVALCARALIPAGWMPMTGPQGVVLALCDGSGPMLAAMAMPHAMPTKHGDGGGNGGAPAHHDAADHQCPFAAAATIFAMETPAPPVPPLAPRHQPRPTWRSVTVGQGLAAPPPPATGPPAFA